MALLIFPTLILFHFRPHIRRLHGSEKPSAFFFFFTSLTSTIRNGRTTVSAGMLSCQLSFLSLISIRRLALLVCGIFILPVKPWTCVQKRNYLLIPIAVTGQLLGSPFASSSWFACVMSLFYVIRLEHLCSEDIQWL